MKLTPLEKAERLTAITHMLDAYRASATEEQLDALGKATQYVPQALYAQAVTRAMAENRGSWPPGPGDIVQAALAIDGHVVTPHGSAPPEWYRVAVGMRKPHRGLNPRIGEGSAKASLSEIVGGLDS